MTPFEAVLTVCAGAMVVSMTIVFVTAMMVVAIKLAAVVYDWLEEAGFR